MTTKTERRFYITPSDPRATLDQIRAATRAPYDRLDTAFQDMGAGVVFDSTGEIIAFHERHYAAAQSTGARMENWPIIIARDFDYQDPRGIALNVIRRGEMERWFFPTVSDARAAHAALRAGNFEYLDPHVNPSRWAGAEHRHLTSAEVSEMAA